MSLARVLVAHPSPDLYGSDRMLVESVVAMQRAGATVTVTLPQDGPLVPLLAATGAEVVVLETPVLRKAFLSPRGLGSLVSITARSLRPMLRLLSRTRPDVVYVNTVTIPGWLLAAKVRRLPVVCHVHEAEDALPRPVALGLASPLLLARRLVVNSRAAGETLAAVLPLLQRRTRLVYNGVVGPPAPVAPLREELEGPVRLLLAGRVAPRKGTDVAVEALALLRERGVDAVLDLAGDIFPGYEDFESGVRDRARALGIAQHVRFLGFQTDVWPHYEASDIVLVPSRAEPFGNVAVEAALAGRPVVASRVQGLAEIVTPGATGLLVQPGEPAQLADAVASLVADWPAARVMARSATQDALARFTPQRYGEDLVAVLHEVVAR